MAASHAASLPTLPKWDQSLQPTACCTARAFQSFLSLAYLHHQLPNIPEAQLNAAAQGWDGGMRTCHAGARLISSSIPIHIYPFLHFTAAAVKRGEQFPKGLGASAAAQHIDPGVSAVCNTALLSNTAHHGHSRSSGHDAQELMGWWAYCMHRSIPKRIERRWHASDSRDAPLSVCVWFPWTTPVLERRTRHILTRSLWRRIAQGNRNLLESSGWWPTSAERPPPPEPARWLARATSSARTLSRLL